MGCRRAALPAAIAVLVLRPYYQRRQGRSAAGIVRLSLEARDEVVSVVGVGGARRAGNRRDLLSEDSWNPNNNATHIFDVRFLKADSDRAYEIAQKHGGGKLTAKDAKQPVFFVLDWDPRRNELVWHVIYSSSPDEAKLRIGVSATSGEFLRVEK